MSPALPNLWLFLVLNHVFFVKGTHQVPYYEGLNGGTSITVNTSFFGFVTSNSFKFLKLKSFRHFNTNGKKFFKTVFLFFPETKQKRLQKGQCYSIIRKIISTWSYESRVSKHFVIFLNFRCLIACLVCCLLMSFFLLVLWLGVCAEVDVDRTRRCVSVYLGVVVLWV